MTVKSETSAKESMYNLEAGDFSLTKETGNNNMNGKVGSIIYLVLLLVIAILGTAGYNDGSHYIRWFGIKLTQGQFLVGIGVLLITAIASVVSAFGKDKFVRDMEDKATQLASASDAMEKPCTVTLTRPFGIIGAVVGVRVFLNGIEQPVLKNGKTVEMQTSLVQNELTTRCNADNTVGAIQFDAIPGGTVRIAYTYAGAKLALASSSSHTE